MTFEKLNSANFEQISMDEMATLEKVSLETSQRLFGNNQTTFITLLHKS